MLAPRCWCVFFFFSFSFFFFFNDTATTEIYTLSLHDALPILLLGGLISIVSLSVGLVARGRAGEPRSRRFAFAGIVLGALSFMLRWSLINRYPSIIGLVV